MLGLGIETPQISDIHSKLRLAGLHVLSNEASGAIPGGPYH